MRIHVTALSLALGLLWGIAILIVALANLTWPDYGHAFLGVLASSYPGYHAGPSVSSAIIGALYGLVDGAIGGAVFAWVYNLLAAWVPHRSETA